MSGIVLPEYLPLSPPVCPTKPVQRATGTRQIVIEVEPSCFEPETGAASLGQAAEPGKRR